MAELIFREKLNSNGNFIALVVSEKDVIWAILFETLRKDFVGFWSTKSLNDFLPINKFVNELKDLLNDNRELRTIYDKTTFFPRGWDYWGSFVPQPLSDFITYDFESWINN